MMREKEKFSCELSYFKNFLFSLGIYGLCILYE